MYNEIRDSSKVWSFIMSEERQRDACNWHLSGNVIQIRKDSHKQHDSRMKDYIKQLQYILAHRRVIKPGNCLEVLCGHIRPNQKSIKGIDEAYKIVRYEEEEES